MEVMSKLFASISGTSERMVPICRFWCAVRIQMNAAEDIGSSQMLEEEKNHLRGGKWKEKPSVTAL